MDKNNPNLNSNLTVNKKKKLYTINNNLKNNNDDKIKSVEGYKCIGPCNQPNTYYYNPFDLSITKTPFPSCPIKPLNVIDSDGNIHIKKFDKCFDDDINKGKLHFDIFSDHIQISTSADNFLSQIYNLNNITDIVHFLSDSIDNLPIYSQRRLLDAIYKVYYKFVEFPKLLFCKKLFPVLKNIYKVNNLNEDKIQKILNNSESDNSEDLYRLFY
jgi:hypothetical protein